MLAHGVLSCLGRSTITGWLVSSGLQFRDWSASYKLFSKNRVDTAAIFSVIRKEIMQSNCQSEDCVYAHMDDTLLRKSGKKVNGAKWLRDPLGPPFNTNFVWGQRFLQISMSSFKEGGAAQSKTIPVDLIHCPLPAKPRKGASEHSTAQYKELQKKMKLSRIGCERIKLLRKNLNEEGQENKRLVISVDGSYTNETVLKNISPNTVIIGRVRKDAKLNLRPTQSGLGRKRIYGDSLPSPELIRQSEGYQWKEVDAWACGKVRTFNVKVLKGVRWRKAGPMDLQLIIIRPIPYRLSKKSDRLYRDPIYLICTDMTLSVEKVLQAYMRRWGIEVNFKEQKSFLGCGNAQVRTENSCQNVPAFHTAIYSMLLTAGLKENHQELPRPKWYLKSKTSPPTTGDFLNHYKAASWAKSIAINYTNFVKLENAQRSRRNSPNPCVSAILYRRK